METYTGIGVAGIGHGMWGSGNRSGNITLRIGESLNMNGARIGHATSAGVLIGNTTIGISLNDPSETGTGQLITDATSILNAGTGGQLRIYTPTLANLQIANGTLLNGVAFVDAVPDAQVYYGWTFGYGPYTPNYSVYTYGNKRDVIEVPPPPVVPPPPIVPANPPLPPPLPNDPISAPDPITIEPINPITEPIIPPAESVPNPVPPPAEPVPDPVPPPAEPVPDPVPPPSEPVPDPAPPPAEPVPDPVVPPSEPVPDPVPPPAEPGPDPVAPPAEPVPEPVPPPADQPTPDPFPLPTPVPPVDEAPLPDGITETYAVTNEAGPELEEERRKVLEETIESLEAILVVRNVIKQGELRARNLPADSLIAKRLKELEAEVDSARVEHEDAVRERTRRYIEATRSVAQGSRLVEDTLEGAMLRTRVAEDRMLRVTCVLSAAIAKVKTIEQRPEIPEALRALEDTIAAARLKADQDVARFRARRDRLLADAFKAAVEEIRRASRVRVSEGESAKSFEDMLKAAGLNDQKQPRTLDQKE